MSYAVTYSSMGRPSGRPDESDSIGRVLLCCSGLLQPLIEVKMMKNTQSHKVVAALDEMFSRHRLSKSIWVDNGPQFISGEFMNYLKEHKIGHERTTPLWPQANGEVERQKPTSAESDEDHQVPRGKPAEWVQQVLDGLSHHTTQYDRCESRRTDVWKESENQGS